MEENQDSSTLITGLSQFEEMVAPRLLDLAKALTRLGRLKTLGRQAELLHPGDIEKQLQEAMTLCEQAGEEARTARELFGRYRLAPDEAGQEEWQRAFVKQCRELKLAVEGEFPSYRVFPIDIKVDLSHDLVMINKRTVRTLHPLAVARRIVQDIDRLNRERFSPNQFMQALVRAYDLLVYEMLAAGRKKEETKHQPLKRIYDILAVRTGAAGYSLSQFAFDLFRLRKEAEMVCSGRRLVFSTTRQAGYKGIEIPLATGQPETLASLEIAPVGSDYNGQP
ncbi:MAG TPA: hypothetical protein VMW83_14610 [Spirochaetia bacterium]|nr:hypothetical protein [Spirochaetia bacterium]